MMEASGTRRSEKRSHLYATRQRNYWQQSIQGSSPLRGGSYDKNDQNANLIISWVFSFLSSAPCAGREKLSRAKSWCGQSLPHAPDGHWRPVACFSNLSIQGVRCSSAGRAVTGQRQGSPAYAVAQRMSHGDVAARQRAPAAVALTAFWQAAPTCPACRSASGPWCSSPLPRVSPP